MFNLVYENGQWIDLETAVVEYDQRHGGPYDRGGADAYYRRPFNPHYFTEDTYNSKRIGFDEMTAKEIEAYRAGFRDTVESGDFNDWG